MTLDPTTRGLWIATTGELTFPQHVAGAGVQRGRGDVHGGLATVPEAVKVACAQIVKNAQATPALNVKSSKMDTMQMQYFSGSLIDAQVQALLRPYVAQRMG